MTFYKAHFHSVAFTFAHLIRLTLGSGQGNLRRPLGMMNLAMGFTILYFDWIDLDFTIEPFFFPTFSAEN
jgi:hypothetical protein